MHITRPQDRNLIQVQGMMKEQTLTKTQVQVRIQPQMKTQVQMQEEEDSESGAGEQSGAGEYSSKCRQPLVKPLHLYSACDISPDFFDVLLVYGKHELRLFWLTNRIILAFSTDKENSQKPNSRIVPSNNFLLVLLKRLCLREEGLCVFVICFQLPEQLYLRPLLNANIPLNSGKYGIRNHF